MNNKIYDILKWVCIIVAPAVITLLTTLNGLWGWGLPIEAITGTISAVALFLGAVLGFSSASYYKKLNEVLTDIEIEDDGK